MGATTGGYVLGHQQAKSRIPLAAHHFAIPFLLNLTPPTMDEFTAEAFVNRDDSVPLLIVDSADTSDMDSISDRERKRDKLRKKSQDLRDNLRKAQNKQSEGGISMQDRLLEKYNLYPMLR